MSGEPESLINIKDVKTLEMSYYSLQSHTEEINGEKRTQEKRVVIENGEGEVTVTFKGANGEVLASDTQPISKSNVEKILDKQFVKDLFRPCLMNCGNYAIEQTPRNAKNLSGGKRKRRTMRTKRRVGTR